MSTNKAAIEHLLLTVCKVPATSALYVVLKAELGWDDANVTIWDWSALLDLALSYRVGKPLTKIDGSPLESC